MPDGALVVSPLGDDTAAGTESDPFRTLAHAAAVAPSGATIVLREGTYHESVDLSFTRVLTIQNWPHETVWLDGSVIVPTWTKDGALWRHDGWTTEFAADPTFTAGAPDGETFPFLSDEYPMAAHPDQMWIDGEPLRQVPSVDAVTAGAFFHDEPNDRLYIGSDPSGRTVRASDLDRALRVRADGDVVRGIGIRRYAPSMPQLGALQIGGDDVVVEHVAVTDIATRGLSVHADDVRVRNVHVTRSGNMGIGANRADGLVLERVVVEHGNTEHFNVTPAAGGAKITRSIGLTVRDSIFRENLGTGLWVDETVVDSVVTGSEMRDNARHGAAFEISSGVVFANNLVTDNAIWGLKINNTDSTEVWNNTFVGNGGTIVLVQDDRTPDPDGDQRQPFPELDITWQIGPATFVNNVLAEQGTARDRMLSARDLTGERTAEEIGVTVDANVYNRPHDLVPTNLVSWPQHQREDRYTDLDPFRFDSGQEMRGHQVDGVAVVDRSGQHLRSMPDQDSAWPLPDWIAEAIGSTSGTKRFGAFVR